LERTSWLEQVELDAIRSTWRKPPAGSFVVRETLTPAEIANLCRKAKEASAYYREAFGNLRMAEKKP
jgi:hypothetical protein